MNDNSGRYYIIDEKTNRKFCIEPLHARDEKSTDRVFKNGGFSGDAVKNKSEVNGGSISQEESIISEENGFKSSIVIGPHMSPESFIEYIINNNLQLNDKEVVEKVDQYKI